MFNSIFHFLSVKEHPKCENCGAKFEYFVLLCRKCDGCEAYVCYNCLKSMENLDTRYFPFPIKQEGKYCSKCYETKVQPIVDNVRHALINFQGVELFSENYKGEVAVPGSQMQMIRTDYFKDREVADKSLKHIAAFLRCDVVVNVHYDKKKQKENNYYFTTWRAIGVPALRRVKKVKSL